MRWQITVRQAVTVLSVALVLPGSLLFGPTRATPGPPAYPELARWLAEPTRPPDPVRSSPARVVAFFAGQPDPVGADLAQRYPRIVGALDGAPIRLRYAANAARDPDPTSQVLLYDPRGDGRIAEVVGDLETADRVAVLIPGVDTTLANFATGLGGLRRRAPQWQARQLHDAIVAAVPDSQAAVVAWLGYDPPDGIGRAALREERAAAGAVSLQHFVAGLTAVRPGVRVTLVGHSYGSVVAGLAAPHLGPAVTDIVALGSPGMGGARTVRDLHTTARMWAGSAPDDWTREIPGVQILGVGHGRLPIDADFGARPLPTADVRGHDGYFEPGTQSLRALTDVVLGRDPATQDAGDPR